MTPRLGFAGATAGARLLGDLCTRTIGASGEVRSDSSASEIRQPLADSFERGKHHREWFFFPVLAFAQAPHGFIVAGINEELETTNAF